MNSDRRDNSHETDLSDFRPFIRPESGQTPGGEHPGFSDCPHGRFHRPRRRHGFDVRHFRSERLRFQQCPPGGLSGRIRPAVYDQRGQKRGSVGPGNGADHYRRRQRQRKVVQRVSRRVKIPGPRLSLLEQDGRRHRRRDESPSARRCPIPDFRRDLPSRRPPEGRPSPGYMSVRTISWRSATSRAPRRDRRMSPTPWPPP